MPPSGPVSFPSPLRHRSLPPFQYCLPSSCLLFLPQHPSFTLRHMLSQRPLAPRHRLSSGAPSAPQHRSSSAPSAPSAPQHRPSSGTVRPNKTKRRAFARSCLAERRAFVVWLNGGPWPNKGPPFGQTGPNRGPPFGLVWPNGAERKGGAGARAEKPGRGVMREHVSGSEGRILGKRKETKGRERCWGGRRG